jgi:hypothetical protein
MADETKTIELCSADMMPAAMFEIAKPGRPRAHAAEAQGTGLLSNTNRVRVHAEVAQREKLKGRQIVERGVGR